MENRLEELYDKMLDEAPVEFRDSKKKYILVLAKIYATECCQATLEKAGEEFGKNFYAAPFHLVLAKESITQQSNIVLL